MVPDREIIGWRGPVNAAGKASCGGASRRLLPDFSSRRAYLSPDDFAHASNEVENAIHDEWKTHLAPLEAVAGVKAAAREYNQAGHRLDKTVRIRQG
ncbi:hypothetical protein ACFRJ8_04175 [Arthrobacter sp. NPDC056886]|uniref:hypothetical protein n=1 Tax=Arthrobacter sp. NPDC056886 TaxID=3345960 RepID=UPI003672ABDB